MRFLAWCMVTVGILLIATGAIFFPDQFAWFLIPGFLLALFSGIVRTIHRD